MSDDGDRRVIFQPAAGQALARGAALLVAAVRPTLGPRPRFVAVERNRRTDTPELLDQAGVIGRRVYAIRDRDDDMGAMLVRHLMWRMHDRVGDGAATAAVLFQALYCSGLTYVAAGGNAMALRRHLEQAGQVAQAALAAQARPVEGQAMLTRLAEAVCFDTPLAAMLGEIFDIIGEYGHLDVRTGRGRDLEREYVEGMFWDGALLARELATDVGRGRAELEDAAVFVSDLQLTNLHEMAEFLGRVARAGVRSLMLIANSISTEAMSVLLVNNAAGTLRTAAVRPPSRVTEGDLQDMAVLTGGRAFCREAGDTLHDVRAEDLGRARRAWGDREYFGIIGGQGDPRGLRTHLATLRALYARAAGDERQGLRRRIGRLQGGTATLWIGAATEAEMETRRSLAERTAESLRGALVEGAVPGGGAAYLACRAALRERLKEGLSADEQAAIRILLQALQAPARAIIENAGWSTAAAMAEIDVRGPGYGFDVKQGRVVDMAEAGVLDVASVARIALASALSTAIMALTTDVLIHRDQSSMPTDYEP